MAHWAQRIIQAREHVISAAYQSNSLWSGRPLWSSSSEYADPTPQVNYSDIGSGIGTTSLAFEVAGSAPATSCTYGVAGTTCTPAMPLPEGPRVLDLAARPRRTSGIAAVPGPPLS